jgi:glycosyltransferase involved in cell wall biosynthesis
MAKGARRYVEELDLIKQGCVISLYLSARYDYTETTRFVGGKRFTGAVALVIPRSTADRMLASNLGLSHRRSVSRGTDWIDGAVGEWCESNDVPLYVHSPGLVQHIGNTSTLGHYEKPSRNVVADVRELSASQRNPSIGLIGWNTASGLGTMNRAIAKHLPISSWLIPDHPDFPLLPDVPGVVSIHSRRPVAENDYNDFLDGLDVLLFCEQPAVVRRPDVLIRAKALGITIVCVPMIEWLDDEQCQSKIGDWPSLVDLFLCPTQQCFDMMAEHQSRSVYCPWPIDIDEIPYRQRARCESFVHYHGTGGRGDRKGGLVVAEAARLTPEIPLTVYSQASGGMKSHRFDDSPWPSHVKVLGHQSSLRELYETGDVCIQPSRMEGLGLQLLECQAAGMPLVTTAGEPMSEYQPYREISATAFADRVHRPITRYDADPVHLAAIMRELHGKDITEASNAARQFAETRDWSTSHDKILKLIIARSAKMAVQSG